MKETLKTIKNLDKIIMILTAALCGCIIFCFPGSVSGACEECSAGTSVMLYMSMIMTFFLFIINISLAAGTKAGERKACFVLHRVLGIIGIIFAMISLVILFGDMEIELHGEMSDISMIFYKVKLFAARIINMAIIILYFITVKLAGFILK